MATTAEEPSSDPRQRRNRVAFFGAFVIGVFLLVPATIRLGLVVSATPPSLWLLEIPNLANAGAAVDPKVSERANWAAGVVSDSALVTARLGPCRVAMSASIESRDFTALDTATSECVAIVDEALAANPLSGELWVERARLMLDGGQYQEPLLDSLRRSYRAARHEGWIASDRVVVGIRAYELLPDDLRMELRDDVALVLTDYRLADPMIRSVLASGTFRETAVGIVDQLGDDNKQTFLDLVKATSQAGAAGS